MQKSSPNIKRSTGQKMNKPEILAPAGSFDSLTAAVRCGADAVYLGGRELNARRNAANFSDEELAQAVEYCHARGVKVYITLNTLVRDDEMETAMNAVAEMVRQTGSPAFSGDMLKKGVIVRHLVLPYHYRDSVEVIKRVGERFGKHVLFSLMSQYTPFWKAKDIPRLNRRITTFEYRKALDAVYEAGLEGFMQERSSAREEYTPDFDLSGI